MQPGKWIVHQTAWAKILELKSFDWVATFTSIDLQWLDRENKWVINLSTKQKGWKTLVHNYGATRLWILKLFIFSGWLSWIINFMVVFKFGLLKIESMLYLSSGVSKDRVDVVNYTKCFDQQKDECCFSSTTTYSKFQTKTEQKWDHVESIF